MLSWAGLVVCSLVLFGGMGWAYRAECLTQADVRDLRAERVAFAGWSRSWEATVKDLQRDLEAVRWRMTRLEAREATKACLDK